MEYYCNKHYNEIVGTLSEMEADVGKSNQSKHSCEECSRKEHTYTTVQLQGKRILLYKTLRGTKRDDVNA